MVEESASEIPDSIKNAIASQKVKLQKGKLFESAANLVIAYLLALFIVLGYVSITLERAADEEIIFLWKYFDPTLWIEVSDGFVPFVGYAVIFYMLGFTEKIYPTARFKALVVVGLLITSAILFHQLIYTDGITVALFFGNVDGYITIIVLSVGALFFSFLGNQTRLYSFTKKKKEIEYLKQLFKNGRDADLDGAVRSDS